MKYRMIGRNYGYKIEDNGLTIFCSEMENYNKPIMVSSQYGWRDSCKDRKCKVIYPPYKYTLIEKGDLYKTGTIDIECSNIVDILDYFKENYTSLKGDRDVYRLVTATLNEEKIYSTDLLNKDSNGNRITNYYIRDGKEYKKVFNNIIEAIDYVIESRNNE